MLSRTSSTASVLSNASSDDLYVTFLMDNFDHATRRTRKRFTDDQLALLESLYQRNSHPSREEREQTAAQSGMEVKSVTIWFQNRRQTDRRAIVASGRVSQPAVANPARVVAPNRRSSPSTASSTSTSAPRRPSLDSVASRTELHFPPPRTPSKRRDPHAALWENMASSPITAPYSPPPREFVEFGLEQRSRTLEWACARRRMASKAERELRKANPGLLMMGDDEDTDIEPVEAVTPPSTWGESDTRWNASLDKGKGKENVGATAKAPMVSPLRTIEEADDDTMKAALALTFRPPRRVRNACLLQISDSINESPERATCPRLRLSVWVLFKPPCPSRNSPPFLRKPLSLLLERQRAQTLPSYSSDPLPTAAPNKLPEITKNLNALRDGIIALEAKEGMSDALKMLRNQHERMRGMLAPGEDVGVHSFEPEPTAAQARAKLIPTPPEQVFTPYADDPEAGPDQMLQTQRLMMDQQDSQLDLLSRSINRQRDLSLQINDELDVHTGLLEELDTDLGHTESRLSGARRRLDRVAKGARNNGSAVTIGALILVLLVLIIVFKT
ncbi:Homeobox domain-containing protein [Mycena kentingensis (nom. inval.)]|nr:Homeobox domain-containing protein [Mycena kentingensis (nom. inval.)]